MVSTEQRIVRLAGECLVSVLVCCHAVMQRGADPVAYTHVNQVMYSAAIQSGQDITVYW